MPGISEHGPDKSLRTDTPFEYFYDLTGWSAMILENVPGGFAASEIAGMRSRRLSAADAAASVRREATLHRRLQGERRIAVLQQSANNPGESYDFLLHKLNSDWELPFESLLPDAFAGGALEGVEVLLIPHITFATVFQALGAEGRTAIAQWVESGGHVVGWQGGAQLLSEMELSMTQFEPAESSCPGSFFRLMLDATHPLAAGVGSEVFMYYRSTLPVMRSFQHRIVGYFPDPESDDAYVNGFEEGSVVQLGGSTGVHQRTVGGGLATSFAFEVNFRAFTGGTAKLLRNAISQDVAATARGSVGGPNHERLEYVRGLNATVAAANKRKPGHENPTSMKQQLAIDWESNIKVTVETAAAESGRSVEHRLASALATASKGALPPSPVLVDERPTAGGKVVRIFRLPNPGRLAWEELPWLRRLQAALAGAGLAGGAHVYV